MINLKGHVKYFNVQSTHADQNHIVKVCVGGEGLLGEIASLPFWHQMSNETVVKEPSGVTVEVKAWCPAAHVENDSWLWWKTWIFCAFHTQVVLVNSSVCPSNTTFSLVDIATEWIQESEEVTEPSRLFDSVTTSGFLIHFFSHFVHFTCLLSSSRTHTHT